MNETSAKTLLDSKWLEQQKSKHFCVAYSGGMDSQALLYSLVELRKADPEIKIEAIHIHHGVNAAADKWLEFCRQQCAALDVIFKNIHIQIDPNAAEGFEANARTLRYQALWKACSNHAALVTAHHADDQAETVLFRLFRGTGLRGLCAIQPETHNAQGLLLRPLLHISKQCIRDYATANKLEWIEDPSNLNTDISRNFIRHNILPTINERWPGASQRIEQAAQHLQDAQHILDNYLRQELKHMCDERRQIDVITLRQFTRAHQALLLRLWIRQHSLGAPSSKQLDQILNFLHSKEDSQPQLAWGEHVIRRFDGRLGIYPQRPPMHLDIIAWDGKGTLTLPQEVGELNITLAIGGLRPPHNNETISIRWKSEGFKFRPAGHKHSKDYKNMMQEWRIPPWERQRVPLLYYNDTCVAIADYVIAKEYTQDPMELGFHINWLSKGF